MSEVQPAESLKTILSMDIMVDGLLAQFNSKRFIENEDGSREPYNEYAAAREYFENLKQETKLDNKKLAYEIISRTSMEPENIIRDTLGAGIGSDWDEASKEISKTILVEELRILHPEIEEEYERREAEIKP